MALTWEQALDEIPPTVAKFMAGKIKKKWEKSHKTFKEIKASTASSRSRRRRKASRGVDSVLFDEGEMLRATHSLNLGKRKAAVTNTDRKAIPQFFGVPSQNLPARDIFKAVIEDEVDKDRDMKIVNRLLDKFERNWERRRP